MNKLFPIYSIFVGFGITLVWSILLITGAAYKSYSSNGILFIHVLGEYITSATLLVSGFFSLKNYGIFNRINDIAAGMLFILTLHAFNSYLYNNDILMAYSFLALRVLEWVKMKWNWKYLVIQ